MQVVRPDPIPDTRLPVRAEGISAPDRTLVARAAEGDVGAFTALVTALHPTVYRWALVFAHDADEADDVAQDAFVQMHLRLAQHHGDAPLEAWLYRIVRHAAGQRRRTL